MALILNIDTALETGSVTLALDGTPLARMINNDQKDHAAWLHISIKDMLKSSGSSLKDLNAVAVTSGPGSYTGIRVGMASAKGLCYALGIPLITINTLVAMAWSQQAQQPAEPGPGNAGYCPMIDARRDEVFTAVYDSNQHELLAPGAISVSDSPYQDLLSKGPVIFFGSGSEKWKALCSHKNAVFQKWDYAYFNLAYLSENLYVKNAFADLAYVQPDYLKEVYTYKKN
ncbi:MAG: tRNA (adenosine(37)-N6)-threonylcarbamoyltransferase complex dimerization subunit type 1 TsaB [Chitinophagaceae bacterium]|nr:MAG: tRNA (adenosine(37)-N6)-threonylcarbamoyltransferase complex dimerization subunit type 1 TsaB [Chitinophagaceae bacterium]